jgi:hypothetical protein
MPASKEQKTNATEFLDLIKKSKGGLKVYFAVGKGGDGGAVHVDKKKPKFCVATLKAQRVTTILASGQLKMEDQLTLYCLRDANENAVRKAFFAFFKEADVSIPGVTESKIRVLGPKEWDSASEDEEAGGRSTQTAQPPPSGTDGAAGPELPPTASATGAAAAPAPATAPGKQPANDLVAEYQKLVPEMKRKAAEQPPLQEPLTRTAKQFQEALNGGQLEDAKAALEQLVQILAGPVQDPAQEFAKRYAALKPRLEQAVREGRGDTSKMRAGAQFAVEAANQKEFARALKALEQLERLVENASASDLASGRAGSKPAPGVDYRISLLNWENAKKKVRSELQKLETAILTDFANEPKFTEIKNSLKKLEDVLAGFDERLRDELDEALNAQPAARPDLHKQALAILDEYLNYVKTDPFIDAVDSNPFVPVSVRDPLEKTLNGIAGQLRS